MNNGLKITGIVFSLIILVVTLPAYGVSPVKAPIDYETTTDDSMIECKHDQTLVFSKIHKNYFCLDNATVIEWVELGLVEIVGNKTITTSSEITSAGCQEGFLPIFRYEFEGVICTPEQTANLWAELGIAKIVEVSADKPVVCGENMVSVIRDNESSKSSNKIICVTVDTAERWIASGTATLVGFEVVEKIIIEEPEMIEATIEEPVKEIMEEKMVEETEEIMKEITIMVTDGLARSEFESQMSEIYNFYAVSSSVNVETGTIQNISVPCRSGDFAISGGFSTENSGDIEILESRPIETNAFSSAWQVKAFNEGNSDSKIVIYAVCSAF